MVFGAGNAICDAIIAHEEDGWTVETLDPSRVQAQMDERVSTKEFHREVSERVRASRVGIRASANKGTLSIFRAMEYMMVARISQQARRAERACEHMDRWCPWLIAST